MKIQNSDTPSLLIDKSKLLNNILRMQAIADSNGVKLRPHTKTHKSSYIAGLQVENGARGIAVAKLGEAEVMADNGFTDIQIANIIVGEKKIQRLLELHSRIERITSTTDSIYSAKPINDAFEQQNKVFEIFIEINSGLDRSGLNEYDEIYQLAKFINESKGLKLAGLLTHAGQAYSAKSIEEVREIGKYEGEFMVSIAEKLRNDGFVIPEVSAGSTPTAPYCSSIKGITEIRPGNYVFYDMTQVSLGSCSIDDCSQSILATVIGMPAFDRVVLDSGAKALNLDVVRNPINGYSGYGYIIGKNAIIERLSEEHGVVSHQKENFFVGEKVRIIPNHACTVMNLYDMAYITDGNEVVEEIPIPGRGKIL